MNFVQTASIRLIELYQQKLSPRKGFVCAHNVVFRQGGCSGFAKTQIAGKGVVRGLQALVQRFRECAVAAKVVQTMRATRAKNRLSARGIATAAALSMATTNAASSGAELLQRSSCAPESSDYMPLDRCINGKKDDTVGEHVAKSCAIDCAGHTAFGACSAFF